MVSMLRVLTNGEWVCSPFSSDIVRSGAAGACEDSASRP